MHKKQDIILIHVGCEKDVKKFAKILQQYYEENNLTVWKNLGNEEK